MSVRSRQVTAAAGAGIVVVALLPAVSAGAAPPTYRHSEHVLVLSVDGMHQSDLARYVRAHPGSALAGLTRRGAQFTHAQTTFPSDSFPGSVAPCTGGTPATTGVFYDDTWSHALLLAGRPGDVPDGVPAPLSRGEHRL